MSAYPEKVMRAHYQRTCDSRELGERTYQARAEEGHPRFKGLILSQLLSTLAWTAERLNDVLSHETSRYVPTFIWREETWCAAIELHTKRDEDDDWSFLTNYVIETHHKTQSPEEALVSCIDEAVEKEGGILDE